MREGRKHVKCIIVAKKQKGDKLGETKTEMVGELS